MRCSPFSFVLALFAPLLIALPAQAGERQDLAITVYNQDVALVREVRSFDLREGVQEVAYDGVAATIEPTSVRFSADGVAVLEQNFEFDLVGRQALLERYLGQTLDAQLKDEVVRGRLLSTSGGIVLEEKGGEVRMISPDAVTSLRFPELPDGLIVKPTLRWMLNAERAGSASGELAYLANRVSWEASYIAVVGRGDDELEWSGWVQVTNKSGTAYADATLKLMAGDLHTARTPRGRPKFERMLAAEAETDGFQEKEFFEYHLYTLPRRVTLADNQVKQIQLIEPTTTPAEKVYTYEGWRGGEDVAVSLEFENAEDRGLGLPLPAGLVRMYKEDDDGTLQLIGEDRIDHTPRDEEVRLSTGSAFDIVAERKQTDMKRLGGRAREHAFEVELRNRKDEAVEVVVRERFGGDWTLLTQSHEGEKVDAFRYEWTIPVPARSTETLSFRVRYN